MRGKRSTGAPLYPTLRRNSSAEHEGVHTGRRSPSSGDRMNLVERIKGIVMDPRNEWVRIAPEPATVQSLYTGWIMILAAVGPIAMLIAMHPIRFAIAQYVLSLIITFVLAVIVDALAP